MLQGDDLRANCVVEPAGRVSVEEAIAHPNARTDGLGDLVHDLTRTRGATGSVRWRGHATWHHGKREVERACHGQCVGVAHYLESIVDALLPDWRARLEGGVHEVARVAQHEEGLFAHDDAEVARLRPLDLLGRNVDAPHEAALSPIEEEAHLARADAPNRKVGGGARR